MYDGTRNADGTQQVRAEVLFRASVPFPTALHVTRLIEGKQLSLTQQTYFGTTLAPTTVAFTLAPVAASQPSSTGTRTPTPTPTATPMPKGSKTGTAGK